VPIPRCLRALQLDHFANSVDIHSLSNFTIGPPDNNLELLDISNTPLSTSGTTLSNWYCSGLPKLRVLNVSNTKLTGLKKLTLHVPALQVLDISRNDFSSMTIDDFRNMLVIPLPIHTLIMSFCNIRQMHDDTFLQFPNATTIDLSYNQLVSVNFQYLPHGVTLNLRPTCSSNLAMTSHKPRLEPMLRSS
jgi:Leucine-rich repeat (LRR) protein